MKIKIYFSAALVIASVFISGAIPTEKSLNNAVAAGPVVKVTTNLFKSPYYVTGTTCANFVDGNANGFFDRWYRYETCNGSTNSIDVTSNGETIYSYTAFFNITVTGLPAGWQDCWSSPSLYKKALLNYQGTQTALPYTASITDRTVIYAPSTGVPALAGDANFPNAVTATWGGFSARYPYLRNVATFRSQQSGAIYKYAPVILVCGPKTAGSSEYSWKLISGKVASLPALNSSLWNLD